jgi:prephenate dehydrogenase
VIVAVPVDVALTLVPRVLDLVEDQVVTDVCSTKTSIMGAVAGHPRRSRFVSAHPMAGTENSGPWAALPNLFESKAGIICNSSDSDPDAVALVERMYDALNMRLIHMQAADHDVHVAYVSHVSHVISFALALTVLEKERSTQAIFNLASGGFDSTARLAKSSADMWCPIFAHNRENILPVLDTYMEVLQRFRASIAAGDRDGMTGMIQEANRIRRVLAPK